MLHRSPLLFSFLLSACVSGDDLDSAADGLPSPYVVEDPVAHTPDVTADGVTAALGTVFQNALSFNSDVLFRAYNEVITYGDDTCPGNESTQVGGWFWDVNCIAPSGASFTGFMSEAESFDSTMEFRVMRGEATMIIPSGERLVVAGDALAEHRAGDRPSWNSSVQGVMFYDGPAANGSWIEAGYDVNLEYSITGDSTGRIQSVTLDGSVGGLGGDTSAVSFTDVWISRSPEFPCALEPAGEIAIRDANGIWIDLVFDVEGTPETGWTIDADECDGCGTLWFDGEVLGESCVDTSLLLDAVTPPW